MASAPDPNKIYQTLLQLYAKQEGIKIKCIIYDVTEETETNENAKEQRNEKASA